MRRQLWPGQFVNVKLLVNTLRGAIVVPTGAVQRGPNGPFAYVVTDKATVSVRPITIAQQDDTQAVIAAGLSSGERVVTSGFAQLTDGSRVAVASSDAADEGANARPRGRASPGADSEVAAGKARTPAAGCGPGRIPVGNRGGAGRSARPPAQRPSGGKANRKGEGFRAMNVSGPFIIRPIATSLLAIAVMLGGALGYWMLPVASLPQVDFPTVQVTTRLPGASPDTMASLVTAPLERQFGQIPALSTMVSSSSFGVSQITLQFDLARDIDAAAQDVQSAIDAAGSTLPRNLPYPPVYAKVNPADAPILTIALTSATIPQRDLSDLADTLIAQRLAEVSGVGRVSVQGNLKPAVRIQADLARLAAYGIALEDLRATIIGANVAGPKGSLDGAQQSYTIATNDQITAAQAYQAVIVAYRNGAPVLLRDIADVFEGLENSKVGGWYQGEPAVVIDIQRQPGANMIETVRRILAELPRLQRAMPLGVTVTVVNDRTGTIRASVRDVQFTLVLATVLVVFVVLIFLHSWRATIIAGVALPLSLVATFGVMWFCGFSLNNLSLMALTIGTGFVIDDAIVMIENIVRHIERGEPPLAAALAGAREIGFTVISLTVSLIAVFIPLLFMTGIVGRMFREFALSLTIAVVTSAVVSLTLTPMMCGRILRHAEHGRANAPSRLFNQLVEASVAAYHTSLEWVLRRQTATLIITGLTFAATIWLYIIVPKGFLPQQDTSLIAAVTEAGPEVSFAEMRRLQAEVADAIRKDPDVTATVSVVGVSTMNPTPNAGRLTVALKPRDERTAFVTDIVERLQARVAPIAGVTVYFQPAQDIQIGTRSSRAQYSVHAERHRRPGGDELGRQARGAASP